MKYLRFGSSNDGRAEVTAEERRAAIVEKRLSEALGEPVETMVRQAWPDERLPGLVARWMDEFQPDLVLLPVGSFSFNYESVPLKIERMLGPVGRPIARLGLRAAETPAIANRGAFHALRRFAQRTIGGATYFEPEQVLEVMTSCIRTIVQHEHAILIVKGSRGSRDWAVNDRSRRRSEERRVLMHRELQALCNELHVDYFGAETPRYLDPEAAPGSTIGDRFHYDAAGHRSSADRQLEMVLSVLEKHGRLKPGAGAPPVSFQPGPG